MHFYKNLYTSPSLQKKKRQIVWKLKTGKTLPFVYVVTLSEQNDLMEIYHCFILKQPYYRKNPPYVIGIADSYQSAVELVQNILLDVSSQAGDFDMKAFCYHH